MDKRKKKIKRNNKNAAKKMKKQENLQKDKSGIYTNQENDIKKNHSIKNFLKKIYKVISVFSTVSVLGIFVYALIGVFLQNNKSNNDIILEQVYSNLESREKIQSVKFVDLHGLGDESIVLVTGGKEISDDINRVVILERLTNGFLSKIFNPFGFDSEYITKFSYHKEIGLGSINEIAYVNNISSKVTKDVIVSYLYNGTTYGAREYIIIGYLEEDHQYHIIGTYPPVFKKDGLSYYDEDGKVIGSSFIEVKEEDFFESTSYEQQYSDLCVPIWLEDDYGDKILMVVSTYKQSKECLINLYMPRFVEGKLVWDIFFSEFFDIDSYREVCDEQKMLDLLKEKYFNDYHVVDNE